MSANDRTALGAWPTRARINRFLQLTQDFGASDLHLSVGRPPAMRVTGRLEPLRYRVLTAADFDALLRPIAPPAVWDRFERDHDADFAYEAPALARFRVNLFRQERGGGAVLRLIAGGAMTIEQLGLPVAIEQIRAFRAGLVIVTGPTGSGKSTTLAALLDDVNRSRAGHVISIEDPIEFVHVSRRCLISQREVGTHTAGFAPALRAALREDPNILLIGELRDLETIELALAAAATGILVFATLHTNSAAKAVDRIINVFPAARQDAVRGMLGAGIRAIVAQQLLPRRNGGRVAAIELLFGSPALAATIRDGKTHQITGMIQSGRSAGMQSMDDALRALVETGQVDPVEAYGKAIEREAFRKWLAERGHALPVEPE